MPKRRFQHRKDAQTQIQKAVNFYKDKFGRDLRGMWPSEGSVSEDVITLFSEAGLKWVATDEEILFRSLADYQGFSVLKKHKIIKILEETDYIVVKNNPDPSDKQLV